MHACIADAVHDVLSNGVALRERLEAGEPVDWDAECTTLRQRLDAFTTDLDGGGSTDLDFAFSEQASPEERLRLSHATVRLALACWLDEWWSTIHRPRERSSEAHGFGPPDGVAKFWDEARYAETRGDLDALETMYLCVMLGFRGVWRDNLDQLHAWTKRIGAKLGPSAATWTMPASLEPARHDRAPGEDLPWRRMAFSVLLGLSLLMPIVLVLVWRMV